MFWTELVLNNMLYTLSKTNKSDMYFCMVYKLDWYHHHKTQDYKHMFYQVAKFFEMTMDKQCIVQDQDLYNRYIGMDILHKSLYYCHSNQSHMGNLHCLRF